MRIATGLLAGAALVVGEMAMAQAPAPASLASQVNGKYAYQGMSLCEAKIATPGGLHMAQNGLISVSTGYITFMPSSPGALAGTADVTQTLVEGGSVRLDGEGFAMKKSTQAMTAVPYSFTAQTFTFGTQVYSMTFANGGKTVYLVLLDTSQGTANPNCLDSITATKQ